MNNKTDQRGLTSAATGNYMIERARELTEFCLERGQAAFVNWPVKTLFEYCFFHLVDRGAFVCRAQGGLASCMFAWGVPLAEIRAANQAGAPVFQWARSRPESDAIFLAEVVGSRRFLPVLFKGAAARWPDWQDKRIFTYRAGALVELPSALIKRLIFGETNLARCPDTNRPQARELLVSPQQSL